MYNEKDKKHFDCQLSLAKAEDKLRRIKETCNDIEADVAIDYILEIIKE